MPLRTLPGYNNQALLNLIVCSAGNTSLVGKIMSVVTPDIHGVEKRVLVKFINGETQEYKINHLVNYAAVVEGLDKELTEKRAKLYKAMEI